MKSTLIKTVIITIFSLLMTNCTKEISKELTHNNQMVVLGSISNETEPIVVTIQNTVALQSTNKFSAVNDAMVIVYEKDTAGNTQMLTNTFTIANGKYTSTTPIAATIGNQYWIEILFTDGTMMKSEAEELKPVVPILDLEIEDPEIVKVRFNDPIGVNNFYKYTLNLWNKGAIVLTDRSEFDDILIDGNENTFIEAYRLKDEDKDNDGLDDKVIHDTVEVILCAINLKSYQFYAKLSQEKYLIQNNDGALDQFFATPPSNLFGNIKNVTTSKKVLGNFSVNAISKLRKTVEN